MIDVKELAKRLHSKEAAKILFEIADGTRKEDLSDVELERLLEKVQHLKKGQPRVEDLVEAGDFDAVEPDQIRIVVKRWWRQQDDTKIAHCLQNRASQTEDNERRDALMGLAEKFRIFGHIWQQIEDIKSDLFFYLAREDEYAKEERQAIQEESGDE